MRNNNQLDATIDIRTDGTEVKVSGLRYPRSFTRLSRLLVRRLQRILGIHYKEG